MKNTSLLYNAVDSIFSQLQSLLNRIAPDDYTRKLPQLLGASIGEHTRHLLEIFIELNRGYETGVVNYELRERNALLESDPERAVDCVAELKNATGKLPRPLRLQAFLQGQEGELMDMETHYLRELAYALDHAVHHMALIRIGLLQCHQQMPDENFGVAFSTQQYRKACAP